MVLSTNVKGWEFPRDNQPVSYTDEQGVMWYRLDCRYAFGDWIEMQDNKMWKANGAPHRAQYWVHEKLYGWILLKGV